MNMVPPSGFSDSYLAECIREAEERMARHRSEVRAAQNAYTSAAKWHQHLVTERDNRKAVA